MAGIPDYLSSVSASPSMLPSMQPIRVSDDMGQALSRLGNALDKSSDVAAQVVHQKQMEWVNKTYADASVQWYQTLDSRKQEAAEGAPDFVANLNKEFQDWQQQAISRAQTPMARMALQERLSGLRERMNQDAIAFEGHARVRQFENNLDRTILQMGQTSMPYQAQKDTLRAAADSSNVYAGFREAKLLGANEHLAEQEGAKQIQADPFGVLAQIKPSHTGMLGEPSLDTGAKPEWFTDLPPTKQQAMIAHAEAQVHRVQSDAKVQLTHTALEHEAMFSNGRLPESPLTLQDFQRAFPPEQATVAYGAYASKLETGVEAATFSVLPQKTIQDTVSQAQAEVQSVPEGQVANAAAKAQRLAEAAHIVQKLRVDDPIGAAQSAQVFGLGKEPLNSSDASKFVQQLGARQAAALQISANWGVEAGPFSKSESDSFAKAMTGGTASQPVGVDAQMRLLQSLKEGLSDPVVYSRAIGQLSEKSDPAIAVAGYVLNQPYQVPGATQQLVATRILTGLAMQREAKTSLPAINEANLKKDFGTYFGDSLDGIPGAREAAYQAAKAYLLGKGSLSGIPADGKVPQEDANDAFKAVAGEVNKINGRAVVPVYGFVPSVMEANLQKLSQDVLNENGIKRDFSTLQFKLAKPNQYFILNSSGEVLLSPTTSTPLVVDMSDPAKLVNSAKRGSLLFFTKDVQNLQNDPKSNGRPVIPVPVEKQKK